MVTTSVTTAGDVLGVFYVVGNTHSAIDNRDYIPTTGDDTDWEPVMPLPIYPEKIENLKARYKEAIATTYDQLVVALGGVRPGLLRQHVFDHEDGLRLIVSRECTPEGLVHIHYSASFPIGCRIHDEFTLLLITSTIEEVFSTWLRDIPGRFIELSDDHRPATFVGRSVDGIPHWIIPDD